MATGSRPYTAQSILQAIYDLADRGYPPKQIETELRKTIEPIDMPHIRTIQRYVKEHTRRDSSGRWSIVDAQPDEAAVLARAIKDILRGQHDGLLQLTRAEARVLHNILAIAPELDGHAAYRIALEYLRCTDAHDDTAVLDAAVAFRPWQDSQSLAQYIYWWGQFRDKAEQVHERHHALSFHIAVTQGCLDLFGGAQENDWPEAFRETVKMVIGSKDDADVNRFIVEFNEVLRSYAMVFPEHFRFLP